MSIVPEAIIDTLNGLLEAEVNSIFCFVMNGSPYLGQASAELRPDDGTDGQGLP